MKQDLKSSTHNYLWQMIVLCSLTLAMVLIPNRARAESDVIKLFKKQWKAAIGDTEKQVEAIKLLVAEDSEDVVKTVLRYGFHDSLEYLVHDAAFEVLLESNGPKAKKFILKQGLKQKDYRQRILLIQAVGKFAQADAVPFLSKATKDKIAAVRVAAVEEIEEFRTPESVDAVLACFRRATGTLHNVCTKALEYLTGKQGIGDHAEWLDWWSNNKAGFDFSKVDKELARDKDVSTVERKDLKTTTDGSGLYETIVSNRLIFVIDTSGSMQITVDARSGKKMSRLDYVKKELVSAIKEQINKDSKFSILHFGDKVTIWKPKLVAGTESNKKKAIKFVKALKPFGLTNAYDAFKTAFNFADTDTIYFLTDGTPTAGKYTVRQDIRGRLRKWNRGRKIKIHTIAFLTGNGDSFGVIEDKEGSEEFMKKVAGENHGEARVFK